MRKLATIRTIREIKPIFNADKIETAHVDGWACVVAKGQYTVGQNVIYFEIDSMLPLWREEFTETRKFGVKTVDGKEYHRLKTIKLRNQISQGFLLPFDEKNMPLIDDLTDFFEVIKYELPDNIKILPSNAKGPFPGFIPKTDVERAQNIDFTELVGEFFYVEEKMDGSSCTVYKKDGVIGICSRNMELKMEEAGHFGKAAQPVIEFLKKCRVDNIAIQGEVCGPGIQKNIHGLKDYVMFVFDVYDIKKGRYFTGAELASFLINNIEAGALVHVLPFDVIEIQIGDTVCKLRERYNQPIDKYNVLQVLRKTATKTEGFVFKNRHDAAKRFKIVRDDYLLSDKD